MNSVIHVDHKYSKRFFESQRGKRLIHIIVHRNECGAVKGYIGGPVIAGTTAVLRRYPTGDLKNLPVDNEEANRLAKKICSMREKYNVDSIVIECTYSVTVARAIELAANKSLGYIPMDASAGSIIDKKVYAAMMDAFEKVIGKEGVEWRAQMCRERTHK